MEDQYLQMTHKDELSDLTKLVHTIKKHFPNKRSNATTTERPKHTKIIMKSAHIIYAIFRSILMKTPARIRKNFVNHVGKETV